MNYHHLDQNERNLIQCFFNVEKISIREIARQINDCPRIKTNSFNGFYDAELVDKKAFNRHQNKYFFNNQKYHEFSNLLHHYFDKRYFGIKATYHLIETKFPNVKKPCLRQAFNLIKGYKWILTPNDCLRHYCKNGPKWKKGIFSEFDGKLVLPIWLRPKFVDLRRFYGDWEVDLIIGHQSTGYDNLLTFNERVSRKVFIKWVKSKNPLKINSVIKQIVHENHLYVRTIRVDNGIEFQKIWLLAYWLNCKVYFCEPYASYQLGSNKNLSGIVRRTYKRAQILMKLLMNKFTICKKKLIICPEKCLIED